LFVHVLVDVLVLVLDPYRHIFESIAAFDVEPS